MSLDLGLEPWFLIILMLFELLLIFIPAIIAMKLENKTIKEEFIEMGFHKNKDSIYKNFEKIIIGIGLGFFFFLIGRYILFFFRNIIVKNIFGTVFVEQAQEGAIKTTPVQPNLVQLIIIILLHIFIIAICEEAFFRGFIINKLKDKQNILLVVIFSSICFTFYHIPPFIVPLSTIITYFGYYFTFSIFLTAVFIVFDYSLIPGVVAHCLFNILIIL